MVAGCGYTDPGDGTETLLVQARITYSAQQARALLDVQIERDGSVVNGASVVVVDAASGRKYELPQDGNRYRSSLDDYHRRMRLRVESDADALEAQIEGPGPHTIAQPENNARLSSTELSNLRVAWKTSDGLRADEVRIRLNEDTCRLTTGRDVGNASLACAEEASGAATLVVERVNRVQLAGGTAGSSMELGYRASNQLIVED